MALSSVQISNLALARIGILQGIDDLEEASDEARACNLHFDACRDDLLAAHDWPFARRTAGLGLVSDDPEDGWAYSYRLPSDCLVARTIGDGYAFKITSDASGGLLYANTNPATLIYTARVEDVALLPHDVGMLLASRLAMDVAPALSRSDSVTDRAAQRFRTDLAAATTTRQNEPEQDEHREAEAISGRE